MSCLNDSYYSWKVLIRFQRGSSVWIHVCTSYTTCPQILFYLPRYVLWESNTALFHGSVHVPPSITACITILNLLSTAASPPPEYPQQWRDWVLDVSTLAELLNELRKKKKIDRPQVHAVRAWSAQKLVWLRVCKGLASPDYPEVARWPKALDFEDFVIVWRSGFRMVARVSQMHNIYTVNFQNKLFQSCDNA